MPCAIQQVDLSTHRIFEQTLHWFRDFRVSKHSPRPKGSSRSASHSMFRSKPCAPKLRFIFATQIMTGFIHWTTTQRIHGIQCRCPSTSTGQQEISQPVSQTSDPKSRGKTIILPTKIIQNSHLECPGVPAFGRFSQTGGILKMDGLWWKTLLNPFKIDDLGVPLF